LKAPATAQTEPRPKDMLLSASRVDRVRSIVRMC
jgi:hypothetical protein